MLNEYMKSQQYSDMIDGIEDGDERYEAHQKEYLDALERLNLDLKTVDSIDSPATLMMIAAKDAAYKKGFQDGVRLIMECMSSGGPVVNLIQKEAVDDDK